MSTSRPTRPALRPGRTLLWLAASLAGGAACGWIAYALQPVFSPLVLQPLLLGAACGGLAMLAAWWGNVGHRRSLLAGTVLSALVAVGSLHYSSYLDQQRELDRKVRSLGLGALAMPQLGMADNFPGFMRHAAQRGRVVFYHRLIGWQVWLLWLVETGLVVLGGWLVAAPLSRQPYCSGCDSWYRVVRQGELPRDAVGQAADMFGLPAADTGLSYRLFRCRSGCGPAAIELAWPATPGQKGPRPAGRKSLWLDDQQAAAWNGLLDRDVRRKQDAQ
jgi:hypothetical protein